MYDVRFTVTFKLMDNNTSDSLITDYRLTFVIPKILNNLSQVPFAKSSTTSIEGLPYLKYMTINNNGEAFVYFSEIIKPVLNFYKINTR